MAAPDPIENDEDEVVEDEPEQDEEPEEEDCHDWCNECGECPCACDDDRDDPDPDPPAAAAALLPANLQSFIINYQPECGCPNCQKAKEWMQNVGWVGVPHSGDEVRRLVERLRHQGLIARKPGLGDEPMPQPPAQPVAHEPEPIVEPLVAIKRTLDETPADPANTTIKSMVGAGAYCMFFSINGVGFKFYTSETVRDRAFANQVAAAKAGLAPAAWQTFNANQAGDGRSNKFTYGYTTEVADPGGLDAGEVAELSRKLLALGFRPADMSSRNAGRIDGRPVVVDFSNFIGDPPKIG